MECAVLDLDVIRQSARPLTGSPADYDSLIDLCGNSRFVLIGEASHGTEEFYRTRALITQRLIAERGFGAVVVEADWPDAARVNRYVRGEGADRSAGAALSSFNKFPQWMWRNTAVRDFVGWLRDWNDKAPSEQRAGFYGMDLYSLYRSRDEVIRYLEQADPEAARRARAQYACFDHFGDDPQAYGYAVSYGAALPCHEAAIRQLIELQSRRADPADDYDEHFHAEQNARLVKNAEEYYRTMFAGRVSSWNLRDRHMADTIDALAAHLDRRVGRAKIIVWAHNSHLGDARATDSAQRGEWNVGQLVRERHPGEAFLIGFTTYAGTVMAADDWGEPGHVKRVRPGMAGSYERLFHDAGDPAFVLTLGDNARLKEQLRRKTLERAIGVIYRPDTERWSHYFEARLADQFDAVIHVDETRAVQPVRAVADAPDQELVPETYPTGV
jgi:erythromycin esterase-like protein